MREQDMQALSAKEAFRRGILRGNPVLMLCLGLFPAIMLATTLKAAAIVAGVSAVLLIIMEFLTALVLKKLPFWLRIGIYALLSFGLLAGGLFACERFLPDMLGTLSGYLPLLAVNAIIVFRCETCAAHQPLRVSLMDALGASLGYAIVLLLLGFFRELLGSGSMLGHSFPALPRITGLLMPFGGFLLLGFMAAAVKWIYHLRHPGEEELASPVAHVDDEDVSVIEPLVRLFQRERSGAQESSVPKPKKKRPEKQPKHEADAPPKQEPAAPPREKKPKKPVEKSRPAQTEHQKPGDAPPAQEPASKRSPAKKRGPVERAEKVAKAKKEAPVSEPKRPARRPAERKAHKPVAPAAPPVPASKPRQDEDMESFADVLAALNRRRAEQERNAQAADSQDAAGKGEEQQ